MMTYSVGAASPPDADGPSTAAKAMAAHLLERTLPADRAQVAAYYAPTVATHEGIQAQGSLPTPRRDMDPRLADALKIDTGRILNSEELANVLGGRDTAGDMLPGAHRHLSHYKGRAPDGSETGRSKNAYLDLTFSAPKSVSVAWALAGTEAERATILQAHRDAVDSALRYVESRIGTLRTKAGRQPGRMAWITVDHYTSRPTVAITRPDPTTGEVGTEIYTVPKQAGDPQLHTHSIVPNILMGEDGRIGSIDLNQLAHGFVKEGGAVYQAFLAANLRRAGIDAALDERTGMAKLPAIPDRVAEHFSKRTQDGTAAARAFAAERGADWDTMDAADKVRFLKDATQLHKLPKDKLTPEQRKAWENAARADDLANEPSWRRQAEAIGYRHRSVIAYGPPVPERSREDRMEDAYRTGLPYLESEFERRAWIYGADARTAAARGLIHAGIESAEDVSALTRAMVKRGVTQEGGHTTLLWREMASGEVRITTALHVAQERELVDLASKAAADRSAALAPEAIAAAVKRTGLRFDGEHGQAQRAGMERLGTGGRLGVLIGAAGSGKTTLLRPLVEAWSRDGRDVWGTALAWRQATPLTEAGIQPHRARALQPFLQAVNDGKARLGPKSVVVIDELGQVGARQMLELMRLRERYGFSVVAIGDQRQCQSITAGPTIDLLRRALGDEAIPQILTTRRQETERERETAGLFREGRAMEAINRKREDGTVEAVPGDPTAAVARVAALWKERRDALQAEPGATITVTAPSNADAREISAAIRAIRRQAGEVGPDRETLSATDQTGKARYSLPLAVGDRVRLFQRTQAVFPGKDGKPHPARIGDNGTVLEVVEIFPSKGLRLRTANGKVGYVAWDSLRDKATGLVRLTYGDCLTIDSAQGITSTEHIDALPRGSRAVTGHKGYVAESRHTRRSWLVTSAGAEMQEVRARRPLGDRRPIGPEDVFANLARNMNRQPEKESALKLLEMTEGRLRDAIRMRQAGLRAAEMRKPGERPASLVKALRRQRDAQVMERVLRDVAPLLAERARRMEAMAASLAAKSPPSAMDRTGRRAMAAARMVDQGDLGFSEAVDRLVALELRDQAKAAPLDPVHGLPMVGAKAEPVERIEARVEGRLMEALDRMMEPEPVARPAPVRAPAQDRGMGMGR